MPRCSSPSWRRLHPHEGSVRMLEMLRAHGLDAGPTQRPSLAGAITGVLAAAPTLALLAGFSTLRVLAGALGTSYFGAASIVIAALALGGIGYGLLFQRAANDVAGGWLFGMAYGFLLWLVAA